MPRIEDQVRQFVIENFLFGVDDGSLHANASLLGSGAIDSTGVLELIAFLERQYDIAVEDEELVPDNLDSIDRIAGFVRRKLGKG